MPGIKFLSKDNYVTLNYVINQLLKPDLKKALFDDYMGISEITTLIYSGNTVVYGIFQRGLPEPAGVVFFTGVVPYRECYIYGVLFNSEDRKKGIMTELQKTIADDIRKRFSIKSVTANIIGNNSGSKKILEKIGFQKIGTKPQAIMIDGKYRDLHIYYYLWED